MKTLKTIFESMIKEQVQVLLEDTAEAMASSAEECWVRGKKVNIDSIELDEGEGHTAKAIKAHYADSDHTPLTDEELEELNNPNASTGTPDPLKKEAPQTAPAPTRPATPTIPGTPTTKPGRPHPLTPTRPGISPRPKAEGSQDDVQKFLAKRTQYKQ
jgi:hypothetical protein